MWANFRENRAKSFHFVSFKQSSCHPYAALASVGGPYRAPSGHPRSSQVRRGDAGEVGAWIGETHRADDFMKSTPESGRDLLQR